MPYCETCDKVNCDGHAGMFARERCEWCGEESVYSEGLCRLCFFSDKSRYEESISSTRHCKNCGSDYGRGAFHRCR